VGGGSGTINFVRKTSNEIVTSVNGVADTTLQADDDLTFTFAANEIWEIDGVIAVECSHGSADTRFRFDGQSGSSVFIHSVGRYESPAGGFASDNKGSSAIRTTGDFGKHDTETGPRRNWIDIKGYVVMGGTGGTVSLKWGLNDIISAGRTLTFLSGSYLKSTLLN
jgi:hypothetical protein